MINKLQSARDSREEEGFTLIELMIVVVIIGILAAIAIPIFANQQKSAIVAGIKSDVKNTNTNIVSALVKNPTATHVNKLGVPIVTSDPDTVIRIGGRWDNYYIHATNKNIGEPSTPRSNNVGLIVPVEETDKPYTVSNPNFEGAIWDNEWTGDKIKETAAPISGTTSLKVDGAKTATMTAPAITPALQAGDLVEVTIKYKTTVGTSGTRLSLNYGGGTRAMTLAATTTVKTATLSFTAPTGATPSTPLTVTVIGATFAGQYITVDDLTLKVTTPGTDNPPATPTDVYTQSPAGFGILYSSATGKTVTQND